MARVKTGNQSAIGYSEAGGGGDTPIVFLHGVGSDKSVWDPQLEYFGKERRAIAFDYPGYGESDPAPRGTTRKDFALAILSAMDELKVDRAHVCGLSLGGVIAIAINHVDPMRPASLILADSFAAHPQGQAIYDRSAANCHDLRSMATARVDALLAQPADEAIRTEVIETMAKINPDAYLVGSEAVWLADQRQIAEAIGVPTMVLVGEKDIITPPELSKELAALIKGARLEIIPGAGHISNLENPDAFNRAVEEFLVRID